MLTVIDIYDFSDVSAVTGDFSDKFQWHTLHLSGQFKNKKEITTRLYGVIVKIISGNTSLF